MTRQTLIKIIALMAKAVLTGLLVWLIASRIDFSSAFTHIAALDTVVAVQAVAILVVIFAVGGYRLIPILKMFGRPCGFAKGYELSLIGAFFSQVLVTFLSGDAIRVWRLMQMDMELRTAATAIFLDRAMGSISIIALAGLGLFPFLGIIDNPLMAWSAILAVSGAFTAVAIFALLGVVMPDRLRQMRYIGAVAELASASRFAWAAPRQSAAALLASIVIHLLIVLTIYVLSRGFGLDITYFQCFMVVPIIMLLSMLPISFSGWGVREGMMIVAFGLMGFPADKALAVSITFGLAMIAASLPGGLLWLWTRRDAKDASATPAE